MTHTGDPYDVVIVGLGPAAITAAIYAYRKRVKTLLIGKDFGGAVLVSGDIENWPGMVRTNGIELSEKFKEQIRTYCTDVSCFDQSLVSGIERDGDLFRVKNEGGAAVRTRTVIYATGRTPRELGVPGEREYRNRGVTYCATCDGPLFGGKEVAVIGGGNAALEAVLMLKNIASKVTVVNINSAFKGDEIYIEQIRNAAAAGDKVRVIFNGNTVEIRGEKNVVRSVVVEDTASGKREEIPSAGVFVEIGSLPVLDPIKNLGVKLNPYNEIEVNRVMETNIPGFYAAGDVTDIRDKQIVVAAGSGCTAALSAGAYLAKRGR